MSSKNPLDESPSTNNHLHDTQTFVLPPSKIPQSNSRISARISIRSCCLAKPTSNDSSSTNNSPQDASIIAPPSSPTSTPTSSPPKITLLELLKTPTRSTQPKEKELVFSTPPTSPNTIFQDLETSPPLAPITLQEHLGSFPPPLTNIPDIDPYFPIFPPQLPHNSNQNNPETFRTHYPHHLHCEHCQSTREIAIEVREEMRFILNLILDRINTITHQNLHP